MSLCCHGNRRHSIATHHGYRLRMQQLQADSKNRMMACSEEVQLACLLNGEGGSITSEGLLEMLQDYFDDSAGKA